MATKTAAPKSSPQKETPRPSSALFRITGTAGVIAGVLGIIANALHPRPKPGNLGDTEKLLDLVAGYSLWRADHYAIMIAVVLGVIGFIGIAKSIVDEPAAAWARIALPFSIAAGAVSAVAFSIDGSVLGGAADDWAAASSDGKRLVLESMAAIELIDMALFATAILTLFGVTQLLFGMALWKSVDYADWIGVVGLIGGALGFVSGSWMWVTGELNIGNFLVLFSLSSVLFVVWTFVASLQLLKKARALA